MSSSEQMENNVELSQRPIQEIATWTEKIDGMIGSDLTEGKMGIECRPELEALKSAIETYKLQESKIRELTRSLEQNLLKNGEQIAEAMAI